MEEIPRPNPYALLQLNLQPLGAYPHHFIQHAQSTNNVCWRLYLGISRLSPPELFFRELAVVAEQAEQLGVVDVRSVSEDMGHFLTPTVHSLLVIHIALLVLCADQLVCLQAALKTDESDTANKVWEQLPNDLVEVILKKAFPWQQLILLNRQWWRETWRSLEELLRKKFGIPATAKVTFYITVCQDISLAARPEVFETPYVWCPIASGAGVVEATGTVAVGDVYHDFPGRKPFYKRNLKSRQLKSVVEGVARLKAELDQDILATMKPKAAAKQRHKPWDVEDDTPEFLTSSSSSSSSSTEGDIDGEVTSAPLE